MARRRGIVEELRVDRFDEDQLGAEGPLPDAQPTRTLNVVSPDAPVSVPEAIRRSRGVGRRADAEGRELRGLAADDAIRRSADQVRATAARTPVPTQIGKIRVPTAGQPTDAVQALDEIKQRARDRIQRSILEKDRNTIGGLTRAQRITQEQEREDREELLHQRRLQEKLGPAQIRAAESARAQAAQFKHQTSERVAAEAAQLGLQDDKQAHDALKQKVQNEFVTKEREAAEKEARNKLIRQGLDVTDETFGERVQAEVDAKFAQMEKQAGLDQDTDRLNALRRHRQRREKTTRVTGINPITGGESTIETRTETTGPAGGASGLGVVSAEMGTKLEAFLKSRQGLLDLQQIDAVKELIRRSKLDDNTGKSVKEMPSKDLFSLIGA
jgi:hypothetical protein